MFRYLAEKVCGTAKITYNGVEIDLGKPFARMTMIDAIKNIPGVDFDQKYRMMQQQRNLQTSIILNTKSVTRRVISSTSSSRSTARREADPANFYHGSSDRDFTTDKEETGTIRTM